MGAFGFYINSAISYEQDDVPLIVKSEMKRQICLISQPGNSGIKSEGKEEENFSIFFYFYWDDTG